MIERVLRQRPRRVRFAGIAPERVAVSALFLANGFLIGNWAPKVPLLMERLAIGEAIAGILVLVLGLGSVVVMPVFGALTARNGSAYAVRIAAVLVLPTLLLVTLAPNVWLVGGAIFLFGAFVGGMDVAMNANAVAVEKHMRKAIMSSCHGFWSLGGLIGAGSGGILASVMGEVGHALVLTLAATAVVAFAFPRIVKDRPTPEARAATRLVLPSSPLPYLLGLMALFSMVPEGAILDWAAVYLQKEMGADISFAAFGFAAFSGMMAMVRFAGDTIRHKLGAVTTLRVSSGFALVGLVIAGLAPNIGIAILGFAVAGIGIANLVPIAFSAAGNLPGIPAGIGMSVVTVMGYSGILVAPGAIGFIAERTSFSIIYVCLASLLLVTLALSGLAKSADFSSD
ncbi:MFS transporter [Pelagibacterium halotolerans]|uniref:MFS transporter n=1 Tax=Pelagibacterium halotolerans TaxID=531813 RepID=UPI00384B244F